MLLFQKRFHEGLVSGAVRLTLRRWKKPHVRVGGRYRCHPIGVLEVDAVEKVRLGDVGEGDAKLAGFETREDLLAFLRSGPAEGEVSDDTELYRVAFHYGGDGDRVEIALDAALTVDDVATLSAKLEKMDRNGPWTMATLKLIDKHPRVAASQLAKKVKRDTLPFKADVRKLKRLGLTQSFEVGYEISPRGRAFLKAQRGRKRR
jgi:hypothetical protein